MILFKIEKGSKMAFVDDLKGVLRVKMYKDNFPNWCNNGKSAIYCNSLEEAIEIAKKYTN